MGIMLSDHFTYGRLFRFVLPLIFGLDGIWLSIVVAELVALVVTISLLIINRKKYNY